MKAKFLTVIAGFLLINWGYAQNTTSFSRTSGVQFDHQLKWTGIQSMEISEDEKMKYLNFEDASYSGTPDLRPIFGLQEPLAGNPASISVSIRNAQYSPLTKEEAAIINATGSVSDAIEIDSKIVYFKKRPYSSISFFPIRKNSGTGKLEKLTAFDLDITPSGQRAQRKTAARNFASSSVLANGSWFKVGVTKDGVYQLSYDFLKRLGLEPSTINPKNIRIYNNGGRLLPYNNAIPRQDDLAENAIYVEGESDDQFNEGDFVLFYGRSPHRWDRQGTVFKRSKHLYTDTNFYYISADLGPGKRINAQNSVGGASTTVTSFDDFAHHERDDVNLVISGREFYGERFGLTEFYDFVFDFPNIDPSSPVSMTTNAVAKTIGISNESTYFLEVNGQNLSSISIAGLRDQPYNPAGVSGTDISTFNASGSQINVRVRFVQGAPGAVGWLNFIELNARRLLTISNDQLVFRDNRSVGSGVATFQVGGAIDKTTVWNVTDPLNVTQQLGTLNGNQFEFSAPVDQLQEYVAFNKTGFLAPSSLGRVPNQNLHGESATNMIILTHPLFLSQAEELAEFHRNEDNLSVVVATTTQVYNEFSSGLPDITAIKDFMKMFYDEAGNDPNLMPRYLLLMGDGSYDNKTIGNGNTNFVPTYQSANSLQPLAGSYVSDDYFGLLDDNESESVSDLLDLGIGRLPVKSRQEARNMVNKIKQYYSPESMGAWRNDVVFIGDDEDGNIHMIQANQLAFKVDTTDKSFNLNRILLDAFPQQTGAGGDRYPAVNEAIDAAMAKGALTLSYIGHGGEAGWAHERVLENSMINSWSNFNNMPLMITATCQFARFDDPQRTAAGEFVLLNPDGGAIALLTTTRLVFAAPNFELSKAFNDAAFKNSSGSTLTPRLGDLILQSKQNGPTQLNSRNFTLLGDPAIRLAYPMHNVVTTESPDSLKALSEVTFKGEVRNDNGELLTDFNGFVYPTVFDQQASITTLNNDNIPQGTITYKNHENVLFKGRTRAVNGTFEFSFVVPKDIRSNFGSGRVSYYAENGSEDANGFDESFIVGGINPNAAEDNVGPEINLFMDNESFVFGGVTNESPVLIAKFFDEHGINASGNGIGHDIVAILDENSSQPIVLNDLYSSDLGTFKTGSVRYPLENLEEGRHTISLKAWDVYNNVGKTVLDFVVASTEELALDRVINYPNPFTTNTAFYFEHNASGQPLDVRIQVFTVSGKLVKTIDSQVSGESFRAGPFQWDGRDEYGDRLGRGVYVYKLRVNSPLGGNAEEYEKLVILN